MRRYKLSLSAAITAACRMAIKNVKYVVPIYIVVYAPMYVIMEMIPSELYQNLLNPDFIQTGAFMDYIPYFMVLMMSSVVFAPLSVSAVLYLTKTSLAEKKPVLSEIIDITFGRWLRLGITSFLVQVLIIAGAVFLVPAVYFSVALVFATLITADTGICDISVLKMSMNIVKGRFFQTLLFSVGIFLFSYFLSSLAAAIFSVFGMNSGVLYIIAQILTETVSSVSAFATCIWYLSATSENVSNDEVSGE